MSEFADTGPDVGDMMPDLALETPDGGTVNPSDFRGKKLVIFFYPKDDTPGCTTEAKDFTAFRGEFDRARSEGRPVGKECGSTSGCRWWSEIYTKQNKNKIKNY